MVQVPVPVLGGEHQHPEAKYKLPIVVSFLTLPGAILVPAKDDPGTVAILEDALHVLPGQSLALPPVDSC